MEFEKVEENDFIKRKKYYFCPENTCTFKSIRLSKMNEHFRIHTGNKPFSFKICEYQREKCRLKENTKREYKNATTCSSSSKGHYITALL